MVRKAFKINEIKADLRDFKPEGLRCFMSYWKGFLIEVFGDHLSVRVIKD